MDDLEELLRASAPIVDVEACGPQARQVAIAVAGRRRFSPRWLRRRVLATAAGLVLVPAVAAAAVLHFSAETGRYGLPGFTENDTSQYINMCAGDISQYVATLYPTDQALPPGTSWSQIASHYISTFGCTPAGPGEQTQVTGIKSSLLEESTCPWEQWALAAPASAQTADLTRADQALADIQVAVHQVNPDGDSGWQQSEQQYADASLAFLDYDYQVNCLGRDTGQNPPTVPDPDQ
ncbi:MAG: hypothetical protein ABSC56_10045 [Solirubrobacteraceae bacterium]